MTTRKLLLGFALLVAGLGAIAVMIWREARSGVPTTLVLRPEGCVALASAGIQTTSLPNGLCSLTTGVRPGFGNVVIRPRDQAIVLTNRVVISQRAP